MQHSADIKQLKCLRIYPKEALKSVPCSLCSDELEEMVDEVVVVHTMA